MKNSQSETYRYARGNDEALSSYQLPSVKPKTIAGKARLVFWKVRMAIWNTILGLYVFWVLLVNRVWQVGRNPKRKQFRPLDPTRPLKVAVISEYYFPHTGGLTGDVHYAAVELTKLGHTVKLITSNVDPENNNTRSKHGFEIIRIGHAVPYFANGSLAKIAVGWNLGRKVREVIEREQFDVIHIHCPLIPVLPMLFQIYADCPLIGHLHTLLKKQNIFYLLFQKSLTRFVSDFEGLVSVSDVAAKPFQRLFGGAFEVIPNGVPIHHYTRPKPKIARFDDGVLNLFFIGRIEPRNGVSILLEAFDLIHREAPNTRLILAGDGPLRPFFEDSVPERLKGSVFFVGTVLRDKPQWFETAHINVVPTAATTASLGVTLLESMASGKPTVCSDAPAFRETISPEEDVLVAKADSPEAFAREVMRLIRDPDLGKRLAAQALKKMEERYSWTTIIGRVDRYTNDVLARVHSYQSRRSAIA